MWFSRFWELPAAILTSVWCCVVLAAGVSHYRATGAAWEIEAPKKITLLGLSSVPADAKEYQFELEGTVELSVDPPRPEPFDVRIQATSLADPKYTRLYTPRRILPGTTSQKLRYKLGPRQNPFDREEVQIELMPVDQPAIQLKEGQARVTQSFVARQYEAMLVASTNQLEEPLRNDFSLTVQLDGPAREDMRFPCELSGSGIASKIFSAGPTPLVLVVPKGATVSVPIKVERISSQNRQTHSIIASIDSPKDKSASVILKQQRVEVTSRPGLRPVVSLELPSSVNEGESVKLGIRLDSGKLTSPVTVTLNQATSSRADSMDYELLTQPLTLKPGQTTASITLSAKLDNIALEGSEKLVLAATVSDNAELATKSAELTIELIDGTPSRLEFSSSKQSPLTEGDSLTITAQLTNGITPAREITLPFSLLPESTATYGATGDVVFLVDDRELPKGSGVLTIKPGENYARLVVKIVDDKVQTEPDELVSLEFGLPVPDGVLPQSKKNFRFEIRDNDLLELKQTPLSKRDAEIAETSVPKTYELKIGEVIGKPDKPFTIPFTIDKLTNAVYGDDQDYTIANYDAQTGKGMLQITSAGPVMLSVTVYPDNRFEGDQQVVLKVDSPRFPDPVRLTIKDDDTVLPPVVPLVLASANFQGDDAKKKLLDTLRPPDGADAKELLFDSVFLIHSALPGNPTTWTHWNLKRPFPLKDAELYSVRHPLQKQLEDAFSARASLLKITGPTWTPDNSPTLFLIWDVDSVPNDLVLPDNKPDSEKQEIYYVWLNSDKGAGDPVHATLERLFQPFSRLQKENVHGWYLKSQDNAYGKIRDLWDALPPFRPHPRPAKP